MTGRVMKMKPSELDSALSDTKKTIVNVKKSPWMLSHSQDFRSHLELVSDLLSPEDSLKVAVKLKGLSIVKGWSHYFSIISRMVMSGDEERVDSVILGVDIKHAACGNADNADATVMDDEDDDDEDEGDADVSAGSAASVGLILPITNSMTVEITGQCGLTITTRNRPYYFRPATVRAMWSVLQGLTHERRVVAMYEQQHQKYQLLTTQFAWTSCYKAASVQSPVQCRDFWDYLPNMMTSEAHRNYANFPAEKRNTIRQIRVTIKDIMMKAKDPDILTAQYVRERLVESMKIDMREYKALINEEMLIVMRQMDSASKILSYLYLGSAWNASNLDELQENGVGHIVNVTLEIDNFFPGLFTYCTVRVTDEESSDIMKYWQQTYDFISTARKQNSHVLVHCRMGVSRSASTVIAYIMKEYGWSLDRTLHFVQRKRTCVKPNPGFLKQLFVYEGILNANQFNPNKLRRHTVSVDNLDDIDNMSDDEYLEDDDDSEKGPDEAVADDDRIQLENYGTPVITRSRSGRLLGFVKTVMKVQGVVRGWSRKKSTMAAESESPAAGSPAAELPTAELPAAESPAAESGSKLPPALSCCFLQTHRKQSGVHMTGDDIAAALASRRQARRPSHVKPQVITRRSSWPLCRRVVVVKSSHVADADTAVTTGVDSEPKSSQPSMNEWLNQLGLSAADTRRSDTKAGRRITVHLARVNRGSVFKAWQSDI